MSNPIEKVLDSVNPHAPYLTAEDLYDGNIERYAILAYEEYGQAVGGTTWDGKPIPNWAQINARQRNGWRAAVRAPLTALLAGQLARFAQLQDGMTLSSPVYLQKQDG